MLTRRELLKLGLLSGGYTVLASGSGLRRVFADDVNLPASPSLTPFVDRLPLPGPPPALPFQGDSQLLGGSPTGFTSSNTKFFKLVEEEVFVKLHQNLPATKVWRYRPMFFNTNTNKFEKVTPWDFALGPTFRVRVATQSREGVVVRMRNELPADHKGFGVPETTTHLHGGHHLSHSDGFPENIIPGFRPVIASGEEFDYIYPMLDPGSFELTGPDPSERPSTLWYHDHLFDFTGPNVVRGLAGFYLVFDEKDSGDENDPDPNALRLPSGDFDIPLVLQDRRVGTDGQLIYDPLEHDGFLGDTFLVNGKVRPYLEVSGRKYRFRFLNGSNARFYRIFLTNSSGQTFLMDQIATEGGLLAKPILGIKSFQIAPAQRVEVVVNFASFPEGTKVYFENRQPQNEGALPGEGVLRRGKTLLELRVGASVADPSQVPNVLRPFDAISAAELRRARHKTFEFDESDGWVINDRLADLEHPLTTSVRGQGEIWHLESGGGWAHPVHLHLEYMRVLRRDGKLPPPNERDGMAKKDTVVIGGPNFGDVDIFVRFRDYPGPFVFHCHNIEHEDMRMMARMDIV